MHKAAPKKDKSQTISFLGFFIIILIFALTYMLKYGAQSLQSKIAIAIALILSLAAATILNIFGGVSYYRQYQLYNKKKAAYVFSLCWSAAVVCLIPIILLLISAVLTLWN